MSNNLEQKVKDLTEDNTDLSDAIKELTEHKKGLMKSYKKHIAQYKILQKNRDKLLDWCKAIIENHSEYFPKMFYSGFQDVIKETEDVKKKENNG